MSKMLGCMDMDGYGYRCGFGYRDKKWQDFEILRISSTGTGMSMLTKTSTNATYVKWVWKRYIFQKRIRNCHGLSWFSCGKCMVYS